LGAVVYKTVDREFFDTLQKSTDPNNKIHNTVSASWEVGFSDYQIAVGSKNLKDAEIISDKNQIMEMKAMLRGFGGKGRMDDGTPIYRLITGTVYPLGIGFTMKPAANVKGVISNETTETMEKPKESKAIILESNKKASKELEKVAAKISQSLKNTVKNNKIMDIENLLTELKSDLQEKKFSQEAIAGMTSTFADAIKTKDEEYKASLEAAENEKAEIAKANEELKASVESIKEELQAAQERITEFEKAQAAEQAVATFNSRMEEIDSIYDLEESDSAFIAEKIKGLDSEEAYASLKTELEVFWATKNKEAKASFEAEVQARVNEEVEKRLNGEVAEATEATDVEEALDSAEETTSEIPNNNEAQASSQSFKDRFAAAFSRDNILS
jgi:DNA repair exonuclease SbcCD ATPase subunit